MDTLVQRYADRNKGVISTFDRLVVHGTLAPVGHADGMAGYLYSQGIRIFDYPAFASPITQAIREHAQLIAEQNKIDILFMRSSSDRKEDVVKKVLEKRGDHPGLVTGFPCAP